MDKPKQTLKKFIHQFDYDTIESTMDQALGLIEKHPDGLVVTAQKQTKGRGRNGKTYVSDNADGLWCTLGISVNNQSPFVFIKKFSVALCRYLQVEHNVPAKIKWPNDIYVQNKKLCGLLAEMPANQKTLLLGFGLNLNQESFDQELNDIAISYYQATNHKIPEPKTFLQEILLSFESALRQEENIIDELYKENSLIWNCDAYLDNELVFVFGTQTDGTLSIRKKGKQITISAGDLRPYSITN